MVSSFRSGRPVKERHVAAGRHLRQALRILGKHWRRNANDPDHVLNWDAWIALGLPRSPTTIDADIHLGVPEERLAAYAKCLGVSPSTLLAADTDIRSLLSAPLARREPAAPATAMGLGDLFLDDYRSHNAKSGLEDLFTLLGGVYRVLYVLPIAEMVNRCAFWVRAVDDGWLAATGLFMRFGLENPFKAAVYRWHNNLHATYLCENRKELGHFLLPDPTRHNLVARRRPFWLKGQGVTDSGLADNLPVSFTFRMQRLSDPDGVSAGEAWDLECEDLRRRPMILPKDPDYETLRNEILAPDSLLCES